MRRRAAVRSYASRLSMLTIRLEHEKVSKTQQTKNRFSPQVSQLQSQSACRLGNAWKGH